ncbi:12317_t:CDS:2, partial [Funneliformis caledonium]
EFKNLLDFGLFQIPRFESYVRDDTLMQLNILDLTSYRLLNFPGSKEITVVALEIGLY